MLRTANPAFGDKVFNAPAYGAAAEGTMTVTGTVNKSITLMLLTVGSAMCIWWFLATGRGEALAPVIVGSLVGGLVLALVTIFKKEWSAVTAPTYCIVEGVVLGAISKAFEASYPGIAIQAISLTFGALGTLLVLYRAGIIRATPAFTRGVVVATGAVCVVYLVDLLMRLFGSGVPFIHEAGPIGIGISAVIVVIAAANLVLDFDLIERGAAAGFPKYMEWYSAFALMVTLIWLYLEILRLLAKARRR